MIKNIVIIGAGNLATQLALTLHEKNIKVTCISSSQEYLVLLTLLPSDKVRMVFYLVG